MNFFKDLATSFLLAVFLLATNAANAEGSSKDGLHVRVDPIIVNLLGPEHKYIQVEITLQLAKPELEEKIKMYMPVIRDRMILLLASKDENQLAPTEGKQKLVRESKNAINQALGLTDKEGVTDVLFTSFIIQ
jgi:flagellar FliL protein